MTTPQRIERDLPAILGELALAPYPDYIDDVLATTADRGQRPAWTFPERWLPMDLATQRVPTPSLPWRQLGVLALIAILIGAALAVYIGSRPRLADPFGPAANGVVAYSVAGDIYTADPLTGAVTPLVTGPAFDVRPRFSRDGSMVAFERKADAQDPLSDVYVVRSDGTGLTRITAEPVRIEPRKSGVTPEDVEFAPDGGSLLIPTGRGVMVAVLDGGSFRELEPHSASLSRASEASYRPPAGSEILFVGTDDIATNGGPGIYAMDPASGDVRTIVEPAQARDLAMASWSPDGSRIAYTAWDPTASTFTARVHVVTADGTDDRTLPIVPGSVWQGDSFWSNDGTQLLTFGSLSDGYATAKAYIVPADGSSTGREVRYDGVVNGDCCAVWEWAPDDSIIVGTPLDSSGQPLHQVVIDVDTGTARPAAWSSDGDPSWQRVAPPD